MTYLFSFVQQWLFRLFKSPCLLNFDSPIQTMLWRNLGSTVIVIQINSQNSTFRTSSLGCNPIQNTNAFLKFNRSTLLQLSSLSLLLKSNVVRYAWKYWLFTTFSPLSKMGFGQFLVVLILPFAKNRDSILTYFPGAIAGRFEYRSLNAVHVCPTIRPN